MPKIYASATYRKASGYTLIEIMVILFIIAIILAAFIANIDPILDRSRTARAKTELNQLRTAVTRMAIDTRTWPYGVPRGTVTRACNPRPPTYQDGIEVPLLPAGPTGLIAAPSAGSGTIPWTAAAVAAWKGPYFATNSLDQWGQPALTDAWGNLYYFDPDYNPRIHCPGHPNYTDRINQNVVGSPSYNPTDTCDVGYYTDKYSVPALVSIGPNHTSAATGGAEYDCDDVYVEL
jgi:type II secretory pathway pseudopilin PulG